MYPIVPPSISSRGPGQENQEAPREVSVAGQVSFQAVNQRPIVTVCECGLNVSIAVQSRKFESHQLTPITGIFGSRSSHLKGIRNIISAEICSELWITLQ